MWCWCALRFLDALTLSLFAAALIASLAHQHTLEELGWLATVQDTVFFGVDPVNGVPPV